MDQTPMTMKAAPATSLSGILWTKRPPKEPRATAAAEPRTSADAEAVKTTQGELPCSEAKSTVAICVLSPSSAMKMVRNIVTIWPTILLRCCVSGEYSAPGSERQAEATGRQSDGRGQQCALVQCTDVAEAFFRFHANIGRTEHVFPDTHALIRIVQHSGSGSVAGGRQMVTPIRDLAYKAIERSRSETVHGFRYS